MSLTEKSSRDILSDLEEKFKALQMTETEAQLYILCRRQQHYIEKLEKKNQYRIIRYS